MKKFDSVHELMKVVGLLKAMPRSGWNNQKMGRRVPKAETVGTHSYGLAMLALGFCHLLFMLNKERLLLICLVHDLVEAITGDLNVYAITDPVKREQFKRKKKELERKAINEIRDKVGGKLGQEIFEVWEEYEVNLTHEAQVAHDLDKLEAAIQANAYYWAGHRVNPWGFYDSYVNAIATVEVRDYFEFVLAPTLPSRRDAVARVKQKK